MERIAFDQLNHLAFQTFDSHTLKHTKQSTPEVVPDVYYSTLISYNYDQPQDNPEYRIHIHSMAREQTVTCILPLFNQNKTH